MGTTLKKVNVLERELGRGGQDASFLPLEQHGSIIT